MTWNYSKFGNVKIIQVESAKKIARVKNRKNDNLWELRNMQMIQMIKSLVGFFFWIWTRNAFFMSISAKKQSAITFSTVSFAYKFSNVSRSYPEDTTTPPFQHFQTVFLINMNECSFLLKNMEIILVKRCKNHSKSWKTQKLFIYVVVKKCENNF